MANESHFAFKAEDIRVLIGKGAVMFIASTHLEERTIKDERINELIVTGEGFNKDNKLVGKIRGCPCPPCNPQIAASFEL